MGHGAWARITLDTRPSQGMMGDTVVLEHDVARPEGAT
jgi:hypothetical protein